MTCHKTWTWYIWRHSYTFVSLDIQNKMLILKQKTKNAMETEKNFHEYENKFFGGSIILCLTPYLVCFFMAGSFLIKKKARHLSERVIVV